MRRYHGWRSVYIMTWVDLQAVDGTEACYQVGAEVEEEDTSSRYVFGEPDISAPNGDLKTSRLAADPQAGGVFVDGWSEAITEALAEACQWDGDL